MIVATNITHKYGKDTALCNVNMSIKAGSFVALIGESGSGKSTLLSILSTLLKPTKGDVKIHHRKITDIANIDQFRKDMIGFIFQFHYLIKYLRVKENILLATDNKHSNYIDELLDYLDIATIKHRYPHEISGGQRQRVAIARALANKPKVIFADEPTGNLDSKNSQKVFELLKSIADSGTTVIVATHDKTIQNFANTIYEVKDGTVSKCN